MIDVERVKPNGLFTNYIFKAIPLAFDESMSYYETLCGLLNYMENTMIPALNNNADAVIEVQNLMTQLQEFVENYFDNLDVQEEINNKLDSMVEDGTLPEIIADYLNAKAIFAYDTVSDMKSSTNLINGSYAQTLGYYAKSDGGSALYKIRTKTNDDTIDEMTILYISDELIAELILNDTINIKQLGAKPQIENTKVDIKNYIDKYLELQTKYDKRFNLYIPAGVWYTSGNYLYHKLGFNIYGDESFPGFDNRANGTIITTYNNNQDYVFRLGSSANVCHNWNLKNIVFSSADILYDNSNYYFDNIKNVSKTLELHYAEYGISDNLFFMHINGNCLTINSCWENYFKLLNFRYVSNENGSIINFEQIDTTLGNANVTANTFEKIMFEKFHGNLINFEQHSNVYNNHFNVINAEDNKYEVDDRVYTTFTDTILQTWDDTTCTHYAIFNFESQGSMGENVINSIELNNYSSKYYEYNNQKYVYDCIIQYGNNCICNNIYNNININGMTKNCKVIYTPASVTVLSTSRQFNTFNNFATDSNKNFIFDVNGLNDVNINDNTYMYGNGNTYTIANQSFDYYRLAGWLPCYRAKSKRTLGGTGLGQLYYDSDSLNNAQLVVKPRTDNFDRALLITATNLNKKLYIRAKVPNGEVAKLNITNKVNAENIVYTFNGTGTYQIYEIELTATWNIGDLIYITLGGNAQQRVISLDCYLSA